MRRPVLLCVLLAAAACTWGSGRGEEKSRDWLQADWAEVEQAARGSRVGLFMWGGSPVVNAWIDTYVAAEMKSRYAVQLTRVPMDAPVFVNKLLAEKQAGRGEGVMDLLWINGENFKTAREAGLLWGPFAAKLPNFALVDPASVSHDFGYPVEGWEAPYGRAQFVFECDTAVIPDPPRSFAELLSWVRRNPGRFTYPQPPDFTGSAFVRQAFYAVTGGHRQYLAGFDRALFERQAPKLWEYLNALEPHLWLGGRSYPQDAAGLDALFERGEVDLTMSYHQAHAQNKILAGQVPPSVRSFVMRDGSIANTHFTAIPFNAPRKPAAMVLANFLLSVDAQLSKNDPAHWGDFTVLDPARLSAADRGRFLQLPLGEATVPLAELARAAVPEIPSEYVELLEQGWEANVLRK